ncbi:acetyl-CoA carboxylase biotin carboxyl carrier protein subunit [candidate division KSB1 bacterium]
MSSTNSTKKYYVNVQDEPFEVFIDSHSGELVDIKHNGKTVDIKILNRKLGNRFSVSNGSSISNILVDNPEGGLELYLGCRSAGVSVKTDRDILIDRYKAKTQQEQKSVKVLSPLPGLVTKVEAEPGKKIKKGESIVVIEAMKMENEITAPRDCVVLEVNIEEGQAIDKDHFIALLE